MDADGDGYDTTVDCDDGDPDTHPGAPEMADGVDNNCDGIVDNNLSSVDDDGDGYSEDDGDCHDSNAMIGPGAVEVATTLDDQDNEVPEGVDNDCDGLVDEAHEPCDSGLGLAATDFARAMELCDFVDGASFNSGSDSRGRNILGAFGDVYVPHAGTSMAVLSTGVAVDSSDSSFRSPNVGTAFSNSSPHPDPQPDPGDGCGQQDPQTVNDPMELTLTIQVPQNAQAMSYDFNFMSGEFPEYVCSTFDDTFLAILESSSFTGNISFDEAGRPVTLNIGFFDVCSTSSGGDCAGDGDLAGTGHEGGVGGGTGWLTTTAPVTPGEVVTLRFVIFDEGDHAWDSLVLLDNFRWIGTPVDAPNTIERAPNEGAPGSDLQLEGSPWQSARR